MESCVLECLQRLHDPIPLPDNTPVRLGRSPETQIAEARCSRLQVEVQVSWKTGEIKVTQLGVNTSTIDNRDLVRGQTVTMTPDSTLFILKGMYPHKVTFNEGKKSKDSSQGPVKKTTKESESVSRPGKRSSVADSKDQPESEPPVKKSRLDDDQGHEESVKGNKRLREGLKLKKKQDRESGDLNKLADDSDSGSSGRTLKSDSKLNVDKESSPKSKSSDVNHSEEKKEKQRTSHKSEKEKSEKKKEREKSNPSEDTKEKCNSSNKTHGKEIPDRAKEGAKNSHAEKMSEKRGSSTKKPGKETEKEGGKTSRNDREHKKSNRSKIKRISSSSEDASDEDAHVASVKEKLDQLKKKAKAEKSNDVADSPSSSKRTASDKSSDNHSEKANNKKQKTGKPATESVWEYMDPDNKLRVFTAKGVCASEKIAGFDIDGCIITTQSGRVFPKDITDWKILIPEVFGKLKHLLAAGYKIVFFTNQLGVARGKIKMADLEGKFEKVVYKLQVPVQIFVSTSGGSFRKPAMGMWQILKKQKNDGFPINMEESFYVGDAAGREENWAPKRKKDFSCSDRLFALNIGVKFHTPEEFFLGHKAAPYKLPEFDPRALKTDVPLLQGGESVTSDKQEVVVLVGYQASGKSTFAKTHMEPKGYVYINQDALKTWQKCESECKKAVEAGKSAVVDNTNVDPETRARYIDCAKRAGIPCRCFFFDFSISHCRHNERFREIINKDHKPINEQIFNSTKSRFKPPEMKEGFSQVIRVNFVPQFDSKIHEKVYKQFLLEK